MSVQANASIISQINTNTEYSTGLFADLQGFEWLSFDVTMNLGGRQGIESNNLLDTLEGGFIRTSPQSQSPQPSGYSVRL